MSMALPLAPYNFSPSVISDGEIEINQTVLKFKSSDDLDLVEIGTHCQINNELVSVEAIGNCPPGAFERILQSISSPKTYSRPCSGA